MSEADKKAAALRAVDHVASGMVVGLGSGSTASYVIEAIGLRLRQGALSGVIGVPTSEATAALARDHGIPLVDLKAEGVVVAIDGMDEVTPNLDAVKGLGGALTREKIVAASADTFILVGDGSKRVARLGERAPVPVEVIPFGWHRTRSQLATLGTEPTLRLRDGDPVRSDNGNYIIDCGISPSDDPNRLASALSMLPGVVDHGLFLGMADLAYVADGGQVRVLRREP